MATHEELIKTGTFVGKFKNTLRDYYTYGFKNMESYAQTSPQTISNDWNRLNNILADYLEWSTDKNTIMYASADSRGLESNPFHRLYRFALHNPMDPVYFMHIFAALSNALELRDDRSKQRFEERRDAEGAATSDLVDFFLENVVTDAEDVNRNKVPNERLLEMADMGFLTGHQKKGKGKRYWTLSELTMNQLIAEGNRADAEFERHLFAALQFYSQFYLLGELGIFLTDRMASGQKSNIWFKHDYFSQTLNDYNLIDLLEAMEKELWCKIKYRHGVDESETELLCYPMEIRESATHGRESLIYYEPFRRSFTSLRLEFIESIECFPFEKLASVFGAFKTEIDQDIKNAQRMKAYMWGVSSSAKQEENAMSAAGTSEVRFRVLFDEAVYERLKKECRIGNLQIIKLADKTYIDFYIKVTDPGEMRPWIRSFYSKIVFCDGMDTEDFSIESDVKKMEEALECKKTLNAEAALKERKITWKIEQEIGNGEKARTHEKLFHECFSVYYYIICDVFLGLCSDESIYYTENELNTKIERLRRASMGKYQLLEGQATQRLLSADKIKEILTDWDFVREAQMKVEIKNRNSVFVPENKEIKVFIPKYRLCKKVDSFYGDIVPISVLELRWLKTMMLDDKIRCFLTDQEINAVNNAIDKYAPVEIRVFPTDRIVHFDRFHALDKDISSLNEASSRFYLNLQQILKGINEQCVLKIVYHEDKAENACFYEPLLVEYSKRNDVFQGYFRPCGEKNIRVLDLSHVESAEIEDGRKFDFDAAMQLLEKFRANNLKSVEITFFNVRNITDRILTEFSPWKKTCSYDKKTGLYTLRIFYYAQDEEEMMLRFMGYGADIQFSDRKHPICVAIRKKVQRQMALFEEGEKQTDHMMSREAFEKSLEEPVQYWNSRTLDEVKALLGSEVAQMVGFDQNNPHHCYNLFEHCLHTVEMLPKSASVLLRVAAFFHDIGKPFVVTEKQGRYVYYNHPMKSSEVAEPILRSFGYGNDEIEEICFYISHHDLFTGYVLEMDVYDPGNPYLSVINEPNLSRLADRIEMEQTVFRSKPAEELWENLILLCKADAMAQAELIRQNGILTDTRQHKLQKLEFIRRVMS